MTGDRLDELAAAWSTDDPDPALRAELEELLRRDPTARHRFLDHCVAEMALVESLASAAKAKEVKDSQEPLRISPFTRWRSTTVRAMAVWAAGLAALLLVAVLLLPSRDGLRVTAGSVVANGQTLAPGSHVAVPLTNITAGADGVELDDLAGIVMRAGPGSTFAITTPGMIRLEAGQLTLEVDGKRAPPTTVETEELVVNVVGTRFRVARSAKETDVEVKQGTVRVTTPDRTVQELSTGMRIAADTNGFIDEKRRALNAMRLIYLDENNNQRVLEQLDQPIRLPADRPFTLRAELSREVTALSFRLTSNQNLPRHPRRIEVTRPYDLWGDTDHQPNFSALPAGQHRLSIIAFADNLGEQPIGSRQFVLLVE